MKYLKLAVPWLLKWATNKPGTDKKPVAQKRGVERTPPDEPTIKDKVERLIKKYEEDTMRLSKEGLSDGAKGIPSSDSLRPCRNEMAIEHLHNDVNMQIERLYQYDQTVKENTIGRLTKDSARIKNNGPENTETIETAKKEALEKTKGFRTYEKILGFKFSLGLEPVDMVIKGLSDEVSQQKQTLERVIKKYNEHYRDVYETFAPNFRVGFDDEWFWVALFVLFGIEVGISFRSIQVLGETSNTMSLLVAIMFAFIAAKLVHDCGFALYDWLKNNKSRGQFLITLILSITIMLMLSGARLNLDGANFILLAINIVITSVAGYLSFERARHATYFSLLHQMESLQTEIADFEAESNYVQKCQGEERQKAQSNYDSDIKKQKETELRNIDNQITETTDKLAESKAYKDADLAQIKSIKNRSIEMYRVYNYDARGTDYLPVKRWEEEG